MYSAISKYIPPDRITVIHANLGKVEWPGVIEHIEKNIKHELNVVRANKDLLELVRTRAKNRPDVPAWPSSSIRQCTSDLKRSPIQKFIRNDMRARGITHALNAIGLRAEESKARSKKSPLQLDKKLSVAGRTIQTWLPIHHWTEKDVFTEIHEAGQKPFWAYSAGNKRLSCVFCILGCNNDLVNGKIHNPELYQEYIDLEKETGWKMFSNLSLEDRTRKHETKLRNQDRSAREKEIEAKKKTTSQQISLL